MSASGDPRATVEDFLAQGLDCAIEVDADTDPAATRFSPKDRGGELVLDDELASQDEETLLARLRRDDVASLLRRGERVKLTAVATEILPGRRTGHE